MQFNLNYLSKVGKQNFVILLIPILAIFGTLVENASLAWDGTSHIMQETEVFWRIHHIAVYSGAGMVVCAAILGSTLLIRNYPNKKLIRGVKIIIIGAAFQLFAGYMDSVSHYIWGVDGKVSATHEVLEASLVLSALGGFLVLNQINNTNMKKLIIPFAIATLLFTAFTLVFDLVLLVAGPIICAYVYEVFSYGCAIL